jgi:hypothetical protein
MHFAGYSFTGVPTSFPPFDPQGEEPALPAATVGLSAASIDSGKRSSAWNPTFEGRDNSNFYQSTRGNSGTLRNESRHDTMWDSGAYAIGKKAASPYSCIDRPSDGMYEFIPDNAGGSRKKANPYDLDDGYVQTADDGARVIGTASKGVYDFPKDEQGNDYELASPSNKDNDYELASSAKKVMKLTESNDGYMQTANDARVTTVGPLPTVRTQMI